MVDADDQEEDGPEAALAKLLAESGAEQGSYSRGSFGGSQTLLGIPSAHQLQVLLSSRLPTLIHKVLFLFLRGHKMSAMLQLVLAFAVLCLIELSGDSWF